MKKPFIRDNYTWLAYFMLAYYAYFISVIGPVVPFLRKEFHINYTVSAFYISAFAAGMVIAGFTNAWVTRRVGRERLFWGGGFLMAFWAIVLTLGQTAEVGIISVFLLALFGSYLLVTIQSTLSDLHSDNRAIALTEANVFAVLAGSAAPLAVGFGEAQGWTWRIAVYLGVLVCGLAFIWARRRIALPATRQSGVGPRPASAATRSFPRAFWAYLGVVFFAVAVEWCVIFWASTYMETVVGLSKEAAASSVSVFTMAQFVGRAAGSRLTRNYSSARLLLLTGVVVVIGFPIFWFGRVPVINAAGLFICGLGVANLFPLTLTLTSTAGISNPDAASGLTSMSSGLAILITPQFLGVLADKVGIQTAYGIVLPFGIAVLLVTWYANRLAQQHEQSLQPPRELSA